MFQLSTEKHLVGAVDEDLVDSQTVCVGNQKTIRIYGSSG